MPSTSLSVGFSFSIPLKNTLETVFSFLAIGLFLLQAAIKPGFNVFIQQRSDYVHNKYCIGHAFGIVTEVADYNNYYTAAGSIDELALRAHGAGGVVSRHKHRAEHHAAAQYRLQGIVAQYCGEHEHYRQERYRYAPGYNAAYKHIKEAEQYRRFADFANAAGNVAKEHVHIARFVTGKHGGAGGCIRTAEAGGQHKRRHAHGPAGKQYTARGKRGIDKVIANAAEKLLHEYYRKAAADYGQPPRRSGREVKANQQAGNGCAQVAYSYGFMRKLLPKVFKQYGGGRSKRHYYCRAYTEKVYAGDGGGRQGYQNIAHQ